MTPEQVVARALTQRDQGEYQLGAGGWNPKLPNTTFHPHYETKKVGSDCAKFAICFAFKLEAYRPGFGKGPGAHVTDYINSDSALYDGLHNHELFEMVEGPPLPADLLIFPSVFDKAGKRIGIGHVMMVTGNRALEWDTKVLPRPWNLVDIVQCRGPNGNRPGVVVGDGSGCARHDAKWIRVPSMWTQVVRMRPDVLATL
jgi:hypothetical protein